VVWPSPELVIACTRLSPLLYLLPELPRLDLDHLAACLLTRGLLPRESTPYSGIKRVPMGEAWLVRAGAQPERRSTVGPLLERELEDDGDLATRLRQQITEATRRSVRDATRLGIEVSGGLDSSMLLSLLVSLARQGEISAPPAAFTFESVTPAWHDDGAHLRSLEDYLGVRAHRIVPADAAAAIGASMVVDAMPAASPTLSAAQSIGTVASAEGADVMLVGEGGDQALDGDLHLFGELARNGQILRGLYGALRTRGSSSFYESRLERLARFFLKPVVEPLLPRSGLRAWQRFRRRPPVWAGPALRRHVGGLALSAETRATLGESPAERYARLLRSPDLTRWLQMRNQEELVVGLPRSRRQSHYAARVADCNLNSNSIGLT
jgi:asparagine synthetase B (glutamine-hydrolysing)